MNLINKYALIAVICAAPCSGISAPEGKDTDLAGKLSLLHDNLANLESPEETPTDDPVVIKLPVTNVVEVGNVPAGSLKASRGKSKPTSVIEEAEASQEPPRLVINKAIALDSAHALFGVQNSDVNQCVDSPPGWYDADGSIFTCAWYAASASFRCAQYGDSAENFGFTANEACCACGGGDTSAGTSSGGEGCVDDPEDWHDSDGPVYDCAWYAASSQRCDSYGDSYANEGKTANEACCGCGGGSTTGGGQCADSPSDWVDSALDDCTWYAVGNRCEVYGTSYENMGQTASSACCVCGGGTTGSTGGGGSTGDVTYGLQSSCGNDDPSKYNMCLDLASISGSAEPWMNAFAAARDLWQDVIVGDLGTGISSSTLNSGNEYTCTGYPSTIDDSYICGTDADIDGPFGVLGSAGPRYARFTDQTNPKTGEPYAVALSGYMQFDIADINRMISNGSFENVILHEMGHVLGIGSLWEFNGLYAGDGSGVYAAGTSAQSEWEAIGCSGRLPVELDGGAGTADSHWDEVCLTHELMTGQLSGSDQPLSRITIGSLEDIGYQVNYSQADPFSTSDLGSCGSSCPGARRLRSRSRQAMEKKPLSADGQSTVLAYARSEFEILSKEKPVGLPEGVVYVAPDVIDVLYEDEDGIRVVKVTREEADRF